MDNESIKIKKSLIALNILYNSFMIFYSIIPSYMVVVISFLIFLYNYYSLKKEAGAEFALFANSILFIPVSFVSIMGTSYEALPLTWFSISILLLMLLIIINNKIKKTYFLLYMMFGVFSLLSICISNYMKSSISQFLTISLFLFSFQIGEYLSEIKDRRIISTSIRLYMVSVISFAAQVLIQRFWILKTNQVIGHYDVMGGNRIAYAGLMGDYSFATLFLATGCMLMFLLYIRTKKISVFKFLGLTAFLLITSIFVSARTGLVSFILTIALYILTNFNKNTKKIIFIVFFGIILSPFLLNMMSSVRVLSSVFDDSGRMGIVWNALDIFKKHSVIGIGLGIQNIKETYQLTVPHNFFIQYLLQFGIIGFSIIFMNFIVFFKKYRKDNYMMWMFFICFIGAMFIPDIVSSRFLTIITIMVIINSKSMELIEKEK